MSNLAFIDSDTEIIDSATMMERWLNYPGKAFDWQECDSPIEDGFFHDLFKFANDQLAVRGQHKIDTDAGTFRLDFHLSHRTTGRAIGIECDGKPYHSVLCDSKRDQAIIRTGDVAEIYRLTGKDINYCSGDLIHLLSLREPWIFSDCYHALAETLATWSTLRQDDNITHMEGGYCAIRRTYFEYDDENLPLDDREIIESHVRTPTILKFMSGRGHPSAYERPEHLIPVPMPEWKICMKEAHHENNKA